MDIYTKDAINNKLTKKQDTLVSGTNIKTINGNSLLGSGNLTISGGGSLYQHCLKITDDNEQTEIYFKIYNNVSTAYSDFDIILDSYLPQLNNNSGVVDISGTKTSCYFTDDSTDTLHIFYSNNQNLNYTYGSNITLSDSVVQLL